MGNGESIKLWGDKWLPSLQSPSLQSPLTAKLQNVTVSSLVNPLFANGIFSCCLTFSTKWKRIRLHKSHWPELPQRTLSFGLIFSPASTLPSQGISKPKLIWWTHSPLPKLSWWNHFGRKYGVYQCHVRS